MVADTPVITRTNLLSMGHAKHGKSSLLGALIYSADIRNRPGARAQWERLFGSWKSQGWWRDDMAFAFVLDRTEEERVRNVDQARGGQSVTRSYHDLIVRARPYTVVDSPGHVDLFRNFMLGFPQADVCLLAIASNGLDEAWQSYDDLQKRGVYDWQQAGGAWVHSLLAGLFGLVRLVVIVTKMDLVNFSKTAFDEARGRTYEKLRALGYPNVDDVLVLPTSVRPASLISCNISEPALDLMPWFNGPCLEEALVRLPQFPRDVGGSLRLLVADVRRIPGLRGRYVVVGEVVSGSIGVGDEVLVTPTRSTKNLVARVRRIMSVGDPGFLLGTGDVQLVTKAQAGDIVAVDCGWPESIREEIEPGAVVSSSAAPVMLSMHLRARIFIMRSVSPVRIGTTRLDFQVGTYRGPCFVSQINEIHQSFDDGTSGVRTTLCSGDLATVTLVSPDPVPMDTTVQDTSLRRLVLMQQGFVVGGGTVISPA